MLHQNFTAPGQHTIGRFRISVTTDARSLFADGLDTGGDVIADWTVLTSPVVNGTGGETFSLLGDNSSLVSGTLPNTSTYDVQFTGNFFSLTGVRLEVIEDPSLPFDGPGRFSTNGNFVLSEIQLDASGTPSIVPEPSTYALFFTMFLGLGWVHHKRQRANH